MTPASHQSQGVSGEGGCRCEAEGAGEGQQGGEQGEGGRQGAQQGHQQAQGVGGRGGEQGPCTVHHQTWGYYLDILEALLDFTPSI